MKDQIESIIKHRTKDNPIYSAEIERRLEIAGTQVRDLIRELRREGKPIANSHKGYFWAATYEEIEPTLTDLNSRAISLHETISGLKKIFIEQSQLKLF